MFIALHYKRGNVTNTLQQQTLKGIYSSTLLTNLDWNFEATY